MRRYLHHWTRVLVALSQLQTQSQVSQSGHEANVKQLLGCETYRQIVGLVQIDGQDGSGGRLGCLTGEVLVLLDHLGSQEGLSKLSLI